MSILPIVISFFQDRVIKACSLDEKMFVSHLTTRSESNKLLTLFCLADGRNENSVYASSVFLRIYMHGVYKGLDLK